MATIPLVEVCMVREHLEAPEVCVPPHYTLRPYRPGDRDAWVAIHRLADPYHDATPDLFDREFGGAAAALPSRQIYLCDVAGAPVGTATAWFGSPREDGRTGWGRVHWVAVAPEHQGRGLGKLLVAALLRRFVDLGHPSAYLTTETVRLPAIRMYLALGFVPLLRVPAEAAAWREVAARGVVLP